MFQLLLSLSFAASEMDMAPCMDPYVAGTTPRAGQQQVPLDLAPAFTWYDDCSAGGPFTARLLLGDELIAEQSFTAAAQASGLERMQLEEPLEPHTDYLLVIEQADWSSVEIAFRTGDGVVVGAEPPQAISTEATTWEADESSYALDVGVQAEAGQDPDDLSVLLLVDADGGILAASSESAAWLSQRSWVSELPEEGCLLLAQEDGAGLRSEAQEICTEAEFLEAATGTPFGVCSSSGLLASAWLGLAGLLALRRRR